MLSSSGKYSISLFLNKSHKFPKRKQNCTTWHSVKFCFKFFIGKCILFFYQKKSTMHLLRNVHDEVPPPFIQLFIQQTTVYSRSHILVLMGLRELRRTDMKISCYCINPKQKACCVIRKLCKTWVRQLF